MSALAVTAAPFSLAFASIVWTDKGSGSGDIAQNIEGNSGAQGAFASQNSIALVGDADCSRLSMDNSESGTLDATSIWGKGDSNSAGGIYGFGNEFDMKTASQTSNAGAGQPNGMPLYSAANAQLGTGKLWLSGNRTARTQALGANANAIGCDSLAYGIGSQAMGWGAWAFGSGSVAFGINSRANGNGTLAFGIAAQAMAESSLAFGTLATASNTSSIALGALSTASGTNSIAIGGGNGGQDSAGALSVTNGAQATGTNTVALGYSSKASVSDGVAIGSQSTADIAAGIAGYDVVTGTASTQTGPIWVSTLGAASVGDAANGKTRQITGLAAGTAETDAVNLAQLKGLANVTVTYDSPDKDIITLKGSSGTKITNLAAGALSDSSTNAVNGSQLYTTNTNVTTNTTNIANNTANIAINKTNITANTAAINTMAANTNITLGGGANVAKGIAPTYTVQGTTANNIGDAFTAVDTSITNISNGSLGPVRRASSGDSLVLTDPGGDITSPGHTQKITNLSAGILSATSTDAINGAQLQFAYDQSTRNSQQAANYLGGGASYAGYDNWTAPSYIIRSIGATGATTSASYDNVGSALGGLDSSLNNVNSRVNAITSNINNGYIGPVRRTSGDNLALIATDGAASAPGNSQKLTNLSAGALSDSSTDAVNGSQLNTTNNNVTQNTADIATNKTNITANTTAINTVATNTSTYLGGGADVANGTAPVYTVQGTTANNVGDAFAAVDSSFNTVNSNISNLTNNINNGSIGPVRRTSGDNLALIAADGTADAPGNTQKLTNLTIGTLSDNSTDAVNGSQLNATNTNVTTNAANIATNAETIAANAQQMAAYLGGGASYQNGSWTAPTYIIRSIDSSGTATSGSYNNVGTALGAMDSSLSNVNDRVNTISNTVNNELQEVKDSTISWNEDKGAFDAAGKGNATNQITNITAGTIAADSTDAVNGSQLYDTNTRIDGIDTRMGNLEGQIKNVGSAANAVQYDTDIDGNKTNSISLQGADASTPVTLHNVANGKVEKGSIDAVNGGQLSDAKEELTTSISTTAAATLKSANDYTDTRLGNITTNAVEQANQYTDLRFNHLNHRLDNVRDEARAAAAIGLAAASLRFSDRPGKFSLGFGSGYWKSEGAVAFGAGYTSDTGRFRSNVTGTVADGAMGVGGGLTVEFN